MTLREHIAQDVKNALRDKDAVRMTTLRMLQAALHNREIEDRKKDVGLADEEVVLVVRSEVKKRADAITEYQKAGRSDLAEKESAELDILKVYLPPELSDAEIARIVAESAREAGASGPQDFGKVMKLAMISLKGKADGARVTEAVKRFLVEHAA